MKKILVIIAVMFTLNCSASNSIRIPIFSGKHKREARMVRCGSRDKFRKGRRQVIKHIVGMVLVFVTLGLVMDNN